MEILEAKYGNSRYLLDVLEKLKNYRKDDIVFLSKELQINKIFSRTLFRQK